MTKASFSGGQETNQRRHEAEMGSEKGSRIAGPLCGCGACAENQKKNDCERGLHCHPPRQSVAAAPEIRGSTMVGSCTGTPLTCRQLPGRRTPGPRLASSSALPRLRGPGMILPQLIFPGV